MPEVHGTRKGLDPHKIPEKQLHPVVKPLIEKKPWLGQVEQGIKRKVKLVPPSQKKEVSIGPDFSRPKPIIISDKAVSVVDPIPIPLPKVYRNEGLLPYILQRNIHPANPLTNQLINRIQVIQKQILKKIHHFKKI